MAFHADLVASYLFEKARTLLNRTTSHGIYRNDGLIVFKGNNIVQDEWLAVFQQTVENVEVNQHLQFTA